MTDRVCVHCGVESTYMLRDAEGVVHYYKSECIENLKAERDRLVRELADAEEDEELLGMRLRRAEQANAVLVDAIKQKDAAYDRLVNSTQELIATGSEAIMGLVGELEAARSAIRPGIHPPKKDGWYKVLENRRGAKVELRYFGESGWVLRGSESLPLVWIDKS